MDIKEFFIKWVVNTAALWVVVRIMPGIGSSNLQTVVAASLLIGFFNSFIRPVVMLFTLPLQILSLGLITLLINGFFFYLLSRLVEGFVIESFWSAFWGALLFSIVSFVLNLFFLPKGNVKFFYQKSQRRSSSDKDDVIDIKADVKDKDDNPRIT